MTKLGLQIPNFNFPGGSPEKIFPTVVAAAQVAETSGFDTVLVMDHFYQLPGLGEPDDFMLEAYTLLGALAAVTSSVRLGALVTGNTYRNPAILAKAVTTLDIVSGGRAQLGIGCGWFELEHDSFGIEFGTFTDRFEMLEEALQVILPMLRDERPSIDGKHYKITQAINQPAPLSSIPVMIGGSGEKKTLRMVAQYATLGNLTCEPGEVQRKVEALAGHCERLGRDRAEIQLSWNRVACIAPTTAEAEAERDLYLASRGMDWNNLPEEIQEVIEGMIVVGDPDTVGQKFAEWKALGVDGFTVSLPANLHLPERVALLGQTLSTI
ncbi:putative F420-dependent oxidoreductase, Rv1855c family [Actinobacteria bacterium IMCC26207]|nr:putative F420-dependent oxidoreductase, Rv1855c family [Actinobacteria bacterium IMCC26207]